MDEPLNTSGREPNPDLTPIKQLLEWVKGNPLCLNSNGECCPDFSCCNGNIAPLEVRTKFMEAHLAGNESLKMEMLGMFLGNAFDNTYITGQDYSKEEG